MSDLQITDWSEVLISDIISEIQTGVSVNSENRRRGASELGILKTSCISQGQFFPEEHKAVLADEVERVKTPLMRENILMSRMNTPNLVGEIGYVQHHHPDIYLPDRLWMFNGREGTSDTRFLSHLLSSDGFRQQLGDIATGTSGSMKNIPQQSFLQIPIQLPPLPEQKKIAEILSGIDRLIEGATRILAKKYLLRYSLMKKIIPHPSSFPNGGPTEDWTEVALDDVCSLITYGFTNPMPTTSSGIYMVTAKDVRNGSIDKGTARFTSNEAYENLLTDKSRPIKNDILVTKDGTLGRTALIRDETVCINQSIALVRSKDESNAKFLHLLLSSPHYQETMLDQSGGSAVKHIYITTLAKMQILMPTNQEVREKVVSLFASLNKSINLASNKIDSLNKLKVGFTSDLLSGRKRVSI